MAPAPDTDPDRNNKGLFRRYHFLWPTKMQIFVKAIDGETLTVETATNTTDDVKQKIEEAEGVPVELQRLIFEGKELEDGRELAHYNVRDGSTLHLTMELEGGYVLYEDNRLATWHLLYKKICRKCYGRLPARATRCRKAKCGRTTNIRVKKSFWYQSHSSLCEAGPNIYLKNKK